ncbi:MAG: hypothetical protein M3N49_06100 [Candidatus Eremiobacteraeota bacterium]|nr:hypothetical protein [Candidatus Eremiobacteraeota bacterium]
MRESGETLLKAFAKGAEISARRTAILAGDVVAAIRDIWPSFKSGIENAGLASAIERSFATVPLMNERAG